MKTYRKYGIAVAIAILLGVLLGILSWKATPDLVNVESMPEKTHSILTGTQIDTKDSEMEGTLYSLRGVDPMFTITGLNEQIQTVQFGLKQAPSTSGAVYLKLMYPDVSGQYSEKQSITQGFLPGKKDLIFQIPRENYAELRFVLYDEYEMCKYFDIEDILVSEEAVIVQEVVHPALNPYSFVLILLLMLVLCIVIAANLSGICFALQQIWKQKGRIGRNALLILVAGVIAYFAGKLICNVIGMVYYWQQKLFFLMTGMLLGAFVVLRKHFENRVENVFAAIALAVGIILVLTNPVSTIVTCDDQIHYENALKLSYGGSAYVTEAERMLMDGYRLYHTPDRSDSSENLKYMKTLQQAYEQGARYVLEGPVIKPTNVGYIPQAVGLWLGRFLQVPVLKKLLPGHLSFAAGFLLGRFLSLFVYIAAMYCAIRVLKNGKLLLLLVALIPTAMYQAANYTYDPWVMAFLTLGTALYLSEIQSPDQEISFKKTIWMLVAFILGCMPKAVYFPIMLMMFLMPKTKFKDAKQRRKYYLVLISGILIIVLALTFLLIFDKATAADPRDGGFGWDISSGRQILYILKHPFAYTKVLLSFLTFYYLNPIHSDEFLTFVGYNGQNVAIISGYFVLEALLLIAAIFEPRRGGKTSADVLQRIGMGFSAFAATCFVATTFYLVCTVVGDNWIYGCQGRYLLPIFFAGLSILYTNRLSSRINRVWFNTALSMAMTILLVNGVWEMVRYYQ